MSNNMPLFANMSLHRPEVLEARVLEAGGLSVLLGRLDARLNTVRADVFLDESGDSSALAFVVALVEAIKAVRVDFRQDVIDALLELYMAEDAKAGAKTAEA